MLNFLASLVIPAKLWLTLLAIGFVLGLLQWFRTGAVIVAAATVWVVAWSLPATSLWLGGVLEHRYKYVPPDQLPTADAIVILGGNTANGRANWFLPNDKATALMRSNAGAALYLAGRAPKVLVSGGALQGNVSEAQGMAHALHQLGVPNYAILLENSSRTTYENAMLSEDRLREHGIGEVLLVTSALHMPRAMASFARQGVRAIAAPLPPQIYLPADSSISPWIPNLRALDASRSIIKEYVGLFIYWLRGWV
jgi:uncharacterized SAM-binding protein YcdF (DUF218 family)